MIRKSLHEYWLSSIPSDSPFKNYVQFRTQFSHDLKKKEVFSANHLIASTEFQKTIEKEIKKWITQMK